MRVFLVLEDHLDFAHYFYELHCQDKALDRINENYE